MRKLSYESLKVSTSSMCSIAMDRGFRLTALFKTIWNVVVQRSYHFFSRKIPSLWQEMKKHIPFLWEQVKEYPKLLRINLAVQFQSSIEFLKVICRYYSQLTFLKIDMSLLLMSCFRSPFKTSKKFMQEKGETDIYVYGETPLTSLEKIADECRITSSDTVFELGCGRGRTCFWLSCFKKCHVVGIEYIPDFVERALEIKERFDLQNIEFRLQDMQAADLKGATVIYLYGTCLSSQKIQELATHFAKLPAGTKIITVSYPLTDYAPEGVFEVMKRFQVRYTWGLADVFLHYKK